MRFDAGTRTRLTARMTLDFDPTGSTVEIKVDSTWYPAEWQGTPVQSGTKWSQDARTTGYFAGPDVASPGAAVVIGRGRHLVETRVTSGQDIIEANSDPVDVGGSTALVSPPPGGGGGTSQPGSGSELLTIVNGGTVTLDDTKAEGSLVGYRVKASTEFTAAAGSATLDPGAYTFERTDTGWDYYPIAAGTSLVSPPPAPGWVTIATDAFTAADGSALVGRATATGGLSWVSQSNGADVLIQNNKAVFATGGYGRSLRLPLSADHANGLRVTLDYELVGGVGGVSIGAGVSFTPHTSGITLDGGNLYPGGSVAAVALTGTTTGIATTGTMQVEFTPARSIVVRINGTQIATAQLGEDLKGHVVQINWEAATTAIDNLVIEAVA